jgi:hypothetical protein
MARAHTFRQILFAIGLPALLVACFSKSFFKCGTERSDSQTLKKTGTNQFG